jgi:hypothetical protein
MRVGTPGRGGAPQLHRARSHGQPDGVRPLFAAAGARARITDDGGRKTENGGRRGGRGPAASGNASAGEGSGSRTGSGRCTLRRGALGWTVVGGRWSVVGCRWILDLGIAPRLLTTRYYLRATALRPEGVRPWFAAAGARTAEDGGRRTEGGGRRARSPMGSGRELLVFTDQAGAVRRARPWQGWHPCPETAVLPIS